MKNITLKLIALSAAIVSALTFAACSKGDEAGADGTGTGAGALGTVEPSDSLQDPSEIPEAETTKELPRPRETSTHDEKTPLETPSAEISPVTPPSEKASAAAETAKAQVGKEFKLGGASPEQGFDNSGLVYYALTQNGIKCPRTAKEMSDAGEKKTIDQIKEGDIAFFNMDDEAKTLFVALYIGEGNIVLSTDEGNPVKIANINSVWYRNAFAYCITPEG